MHTVCYTNLLILHLVGRSWYIPSPKCLRYLYPGTPLCTRCALEYYWYASLAVRYIQCTSGIYFVYCAFRLAIGVYHARSRHTDKMYLLVSRLLYLQYHYSGTIN